MKYAFKELMITFNDKQADIDIQGEDIIITAKTDVLEDIRYSFLELS